MNNRLKVLCGVVAVALAGQVSATTTWNWSASASELGTSTGTSTDNSPNTISQNINGTAVTAAPTGWSNTNGSLIEKQLGGTSTTTHFVNYGGGNGLGINNNDGCATTGCSGDQGDIRSDQPEHAIDNQGRYEMVMLSFSEMVKLTQVRIGWAGSTDSDITVMAYQQGAGVPVLTDKTFTAVSLAGWSLIGNYADVGVATVNINAQNTVSSYWLIGAYNPLGGAVATGFTDGDDYVKLKSVTGCAAREVGCSPPPPSNNVPEPGSLALVGLGLLGVIRLRKARQA